MNNLSIDIETFSSADIAKTGVYKYAEAPDFQLLLFGYSVDGGAVQVVDLAMGECLSDEILKALTDPAVTKWAFNASFERVCLSRWLGMPTGTYLDPEQWRCSMVWSAYMGLPLSLKGAGAVLQLENQKLEEGKELIRYFCCPCAPTKSNGGRTRNLPTHAPEKWELFKRYNIRDVEVERQIQNKLRNFPVPEFVWSNYWRDQRINDRGIRIDRELVDNALKLDAESKDNLTAEMKHLTGLENPNSVQQLRSWLWDKGAYTDSLGKKTVAMLREEYDKDSDVGRVLELRLQLAKSSVRKYDAMRAAACEDDRCRGMFMFYGANRTGRYAGRIVQLQNLARNSLKDLELAREFVRAGDYDSVDMLFGNVPDTLSQLIRTAFVPEPGMKFLVADYSAVECRVLSWVAGEQWVLDAFARGEDIYCAMASRMYGVPVEKDGANKELRQKGKTATLSCIAEGSLVLTNQGLVPIEKVAEDMLLWDGVDWVCHDGVVFKGARAVITYEGLTATPEHIVWVEGQARPVQFGVAATSGAHLIQTGDGRNPVRLGRNHFSGETMERDVAQMHGVDKMYRVRSNSVAAYKRTARVYDIQNAGRHHRFTVSNCLVHNCGYGGGVNALVAMGALDNTGLKESDLQPLVDAWRTANPHVVRFWREVDMAAKRCIKSKIQTEAHGIKFTYCSGMMLITLPSGRQLTYIRPAIGTNRFGSESITYEGTDATKKWGRIESFGGKLTENIVQAIAADLLLFTLENLKDYRVVAHIHDEVVVECPMETKLETICEIMGRVPEWAPGLILRADGFETMFYKKD